MGCKGSKNEAVEAKKLDPIGINDDTLQRDVLNHLNQDSFDSEDF